MRETPPKNPPINPPNRAPFNPMTSLEMSGIEYVKLYVVPDESLPPTVTKANASINPKISPPTSIPVSQYLHRRCISFQDQATTSTGCISFFSVLASPPKS